MRIANDCKWEQWQATSQRHHQVCVVASHQAQCKPPVAAPSVLAGINASGAPPSQACSLRSVRAYVRPLRCGVPERSSISMPRRPTATPLSMRNAIGFSRGACSPASLPSRGIAWPLDPPAQKALELPESAAPCRSLPASAPAPQQEPDGPIAPSLKRAGLPPPSAQGPGVLHLHARGAPPPKPQS